MGGLPRPDVAPGAGRDLIDALHDLHHQAGWPSLRVLAREVGCSHTTVSTVFSSPRLPTWGVLELVVEAMGGDVDEFRLLWLAAGSPDQPSTPAPLMIAGRKDELRAVRRHLDSGSGLLLVTGEAGIGKTRLVSTAAAPAGTLVATGSCLPLSSEVPLLPIADVLRSVHAVDDGRWLKEALGECAAYVPGSLRRLLPELEPTGLSEPEDQWSRQRLFTAVEATLTALARTRPFAVLIEDLHWADTATLDLVEHVVARHGDVPVVGTYRLDDATTPTNTVDWFARIRRAPGVDSLELAPLTRDETAEQLALLSPSPPAPELVDRIHRRSAGQPLFTEQLAAQDDRDRSLPRLLADLLDRRLEQLAPSTWAVVAALGIADRALTTTMLRDVTTLTSLALTAELHDLDQRRLLASPGDGHGVQLRHPLLAEAVRRRLVPGEAADQHRRLARALASSRDPSPAEVAAHWQAADSPDEELAWRMRAAREAHERFAAAQEAEQWLRVLELWPDHDEAPDLPVSKIEACLACMDAVTISGRIEQAKELLDETMTMADTLPPLTVAELHLRASHYRAVLEDRGVGLQHARRAVEIYETAAPSVGLVIALEQLARTLQLMGRLDEASTYIGRAVRASSAAGDVVLQRRVLAQQVWHLGMAGDLEGARALADEAWSLELPRPDPMGDIRLGAVHTDVLLHAEASGDEVESAARRSLTAANDWNLDTTEAAALRSNVARTLIQQGRIDRAARIVDPLTATRSHPDPGCDPHQPCRPRRRPRRAGGRRVAGARSGWHAGPHARKPARVRGRGGPVGPLGRTPTGSAGPTPRAPGRGRTNRRLRVRRLLHGACRPRRRKPRRGHAPQA